MVQLIPMSDADYRDFRSRSVRDYAEDKVAAGTWTAEDAPALAEAAFRRFLPDGRNTKEAFLYLVHDAVREEAVGHLWFNAMEQEKGRIAFILDILIYEEHQGKGYGKRTMAALEEEVRRLGLDTISLHVFGHNQRAFELYRKMGYEVTDIQMTKVLAGETEA
ncbi:GNAT family N-acetyltransferase [Paenibacillus sp. TH7-28]